MQSTTESGTADPAAELARAADALEDAEDAVAAVGEADARRVADAVEEATDLLDRYRESATGTGDFEAYVEFQERVAEFVEDLPEELPERAAFEAFEDALEQRRLGESDFERAREALAPAEDVADRLQRRERARERYRQARRRVREALADVEERIADLRRVRELGAADLDAPVEQLRDPVDAYDEAVGEAFETFRREAPAREVLGVVARAATYPLVEYRTPPQELLAYVREREVDLGTLLEYADYSRSKLDHYVDDPGELKRAVATNRTYLERLDAGPLTVEWPPPDAETLRLRTREYESVVRRFADEATVARCRAVRRLTRRTDYERLREAAVAREELTDEQRRRLREGAVEAELSDLGERRDRLEAALEDYPGQ